MLVGTPKAHKQRSVPLPEFLLPYLARQCEGRGRDDLLFPGDDGGHLAATAHHGAGGSSKPSPNPACRASRRTTCGTRAASLAVSAGANVKAVQRMLGHASRGHDAGRLRRPVR